MKKTKNRVGGKKGKAKSPRGFWVMNKEKKDPSSTDLALQAALETLILQTTTQMIEQADLVRHLSGKNRQRVLENFVHLRNTINHTLLSEEKLISQPPSWC